MKLTNIFKNFAKDESGAVTVDWVVLTAAIVGLGIVVMSVVVPAVKNAGNQIAGGLNNSMANAQNF